jgi:hypothetical protein
MSGTLSPHAPFGAMLTAMISPFRPDGSLDIEGGQRLASYLVDELGHDGLVINGTTGESATTTDEENVALLRAVIEAVGDRATVVAGVGSNDTSHSVHSARSAIEVGAHAVMAVSPYYNRPPQEGLIRHFHAIADATDLPMMVYDIPKRTGVAIETDTLTVALVHRTWISAGTPVRVLESFLRETGKRRSGNAAADSRKDFWIPARQPLAAAAAGLTIGQLLEPLLRQKLGSDRSAA